MKNISITLGLIMLVFAFASCSSDDNTDTTPENGENSEETESFQYLLALSLPTIESYPFHVLKNVDEGSADIADSQEIPDLPANVPVAGKDGYVYLNSPEKLTKYEVDENGILKDLGSVPNTGISGGPVSEFLSENRLLVSTGPRPASDGVINYQIINTETMTEESKGTFTLPINENAIASPSEYVLRDGKIFVPYYHADAESSESFDRAPVAIFNASSLAYEKTIYTEKAAGLAFSIVSSHGITENGDLYITACNTNYWGINESIPSGIVKIKSGEDEFDDSYFFNLTEKFGGNHTGGMVYAGNNKAIVQVFRSDLISQYSDYQGSFVIEYYVIDLVAKTTEKLDIPLCKYPRRAIEIIDDGKVAIVGNTESEGNTIYIYDVATNSITKGLEYKGTEFIETFLPFK